jgi:hypothetical protein
LIASAPSPAILSLDAGDSGALATEPELSEVPVNANHVQLTAEPKLA